MLTKNNCSNYLAFEHSSAIVCSREPIWTKTWTVLSFCIKNVRTLLTVKNRFAHFVGYSY